MKLFTIGFTKKSAETFFELLRENDVQRLVDIWIISMEKPLPTLRLSRVRGYRDKIIEMSRLTEQPLDAELNACIAIVFSKFPITMAYLYGSTAKGQSTPLSDVDIALVLIDDRVASSERLIFELKIEEELARFCELNRADVRVINNSPIMVQGEIVTNGILIYCTDDDARIEFECLTRSLYFDFLPTATQLRDAHMDHIFEKGLYG